MCRWYDVLVQWGFSSCTFFLFIPLVSFFILRRINSCLENREASRPTSHQYRWTWMRKKGKKMHDDGGPSVWRLWVVPLIDVDIWYMAIINTPQTIHRSVVIIAAETFFRFLFGRAEWGGGGKQPCSQQTEKIESCANKRKIQIVTVSHTFN